MFEKDEQVYKLGDLAEKGNAEKIKELLTSGKVSQRAKDYAIRWAAQIGKQEVVSILLEEGANPNAGLVFAAAYNQPEILRQLINAGADVNLHNVDAVRWAIKRGYAEILKILFEKGAKPNKEDVIRLAEKNGEAEIISIVNEYLT